MMMTSDIEGHDMLISSHLLVTGALCQVHIVYGEHITQKWLDAMSFVLRAAD